MFQAGCSMRLPESCGLVFQVARNTGYLKKLERKHSISPAQLPDTIHTKYAKAAHAAGRNEALPLYLRISGSLLPYQPPAFSSCRRISVITAA